VSLEDRLDRDFHLSIFFPLLGVAGAAHVIQFMAQQVTRIGSFLEHAERWREVVPLSTPLFPSAFAVTLNLAMLALSVGLMVSRRRTRLVLLLAPVGLLALTVQPVQVSNHYVVLLLAWVVWAVVVALAKLGMRQATEEEERAALARTAASGYARAMRNVCVITYFFAAFHKVNAAWFDLEANSAARFARAQLTPLLDAIGLPAGGWLDLVLLPTVIFPVVAEFAIPALLLSSRFRAWGALLGLVLHLPMFAREVLDYPSLILAFYPLFFSEAELRRFGAALRNVTTAKGLLALAAGGGVVLVWLVLVPVTPARPLEPTWALETLFGTAIILGFAYVGVTLTWQLFGIEATE
jgi:hypothetical protein